MKQFCLQLQSFFKEFQIIKNKFYLNVMLPCVFRDCNFIQDELLICQSQKNYIFTLILTTLEVCQSSCIIVPHRQSQGLALVTNLCQIRTCILSNNGFLIFCFLNLPLDCIIMLINLDFTSSQFCNDEQFQQGTVKV